MVTPVNAIGRNNVAAAILAARKDVLKTYSLRPKDIIIAIAMVATENRIMGIGPCIGLQPSKWVGIKII